MMENLSVAGELVSTSQDVSSTPGLLAALLAIVLTLFSSGS
ncbi:hypothetical protein [Veronia nyctiphanis]|nr:hypothetical protein [Veronia nyctiphanis]